MNVQKFWLKKKASFACLLFNWNPVTPRWKKGRLDSLHTYWNIGQLWCSSPFGVSWWFGIYIKRIMWLHVTRIMSVIINANWFWSRLSQKCVAPQPYTRQSKPLIHSFSWRKYDIIWNVPSLESKFWSQYFVKSTSWYGYGTHGQCFWYMLDWD